MKMDTASCIEMLGKGNYVHYPLIDVPIPMHCTLVCTEHCIHSNISACTAAELQATWAVVYSTSQKHLLPLHCHI